MLSDRSLFVVGWGFVDRLVLKRLVHSGLQIACEGW